MKQPSGSNGGPRKVTNGDRQVLSLKKTTRGAIFGSNGTLGCGREWLRGRVWWASRVAELLSGWGQTGKGKGVQL
ncbi:uncharacterized protein SPSK_10496 [Sporothrix schenckii 1099-18]|uniref:Uncharacterized protein n=1 Tax=Sporothrix schenckii 1099-18 TaxID=1397361 RepID=A0A0F2MC01_SPOSC|nr:uncharacterized protein SPSK_10496 [Sporothrix schenckii 1099-18]KJR86594.1 hypothetical protein SPSK_10496 [Sporothrix schenckii 1099-18]